MIGITLNRHILQQSHKQEMRGELPTLLAQVGFAAKIISREVRRAALVGKLGLVGEHNPTGDAQKKLDVFANEVVLEAFGGTNLMAAIVSEELEQVKHVSCGDDAQYILCIDPLDGSSNTDTNGVLGTIFGFYRRSTTGTCATLQEVLRQGTEMVAAGYILYSMSTILVYSCGRGTNGFTLDHDLGEFLLSHEDISCPHRGNCFSVNLGRRHQWPQGVQRFVDYLTEGDKTTGRPYSLRYSGALVADLHRSLIEGGIYFYPPDRDHKDGKLRLVYECNPLAFLVEQAGGNASDGKRRILDLQPESIHQRVPLVIGSSEDVILYEKFLAGESPSD